VRVRPPSEDSLFGVLALSLTTTTPCFDAPFVCVCWFVCRYECPVYLTRSRGATFVTLATLRSLDVTEKWVLAGVAIILQKDV
jgi:hypothetical protein